MTRLSDDTINRLKGLDIKDVADRLGVELPRGNGNARCFNQEAHAHGDRHEIDMETGDLVKSSFKKEYLKRHKIGRLESSAYAKARARGEV